MRALTPSPLPRAARERGVTAVFVAAVLAISMSVMAREAPEVGDNPAVEKHMMELSTELRCLQCQNQTIADSNAPLAVDLRQQIREMLAAGKSDEDVRQYLVARYGDFVLYKPPVKAKTWALWFGPGVILVGGVIAMLLAIRRRRELLATAPAGAAGQDEEGGLS